MNPIQEVYSVTIEVDGQTLELWHNDHEGETIEVDVPGRSEPVEVELVRFNQAGGGNV